MQEHAYLVFAITVGGEAGDEWKIAVVGLVAFGIQVDNFKHASSDRKYEIRILLVNGQTFGLVEPARRKASGGYNTRGCDFENYSIRGALTNFVGAFCSSNLSLGWSRSLSSSHDEVWEFVIRMRGC